MDINLFSGMLLAGGSFILYSVKSIPIAAYKKIKQQLVYTVKIYQYDDLFDMLERYLATHHQKQYKDVEATIKNDCQPTDEENTKCAKSIEYKQEDNTFILKYKGKRILINKSKEKLDKAISLKDIYFRRYNISGLRAKKHIDDLSLIHI
jgi:hypothetical protein